MHKGVQATLMVMMLPPLLEAFDSDTFAFNIDGFPLSFSSLSFLTAGIIVLFIKGSKYFHNPLFKGLLLVYIGCIVGATFGENTFENFTRSSANLLLLIAGCGIAHLLAIKKFRWLIDTFFIATFIYWSYYALKSTVLGDSFVSYSHLDSIGKAKNHHIPGLKLSVSAVYVAVRFFYSSNKLNIQGFFIFGIALLCCLLIESRSNLTFTIVTLLILVIKDSKKLGRLLFVILPLFYGFWLATDYFLSQYDFLSQRFDLQDEANRKRASFARMNALMQAPNLLLEYPLGRGIRNIYFDFGIGYKLLSHNQYITYILAGGIVALIGTGIWVKSLFIIAKKSIFSKMNNVRNSFVPAISMTVIIFHFTLVSIEFAGMFFSIITTIGVFAIQIVLDNNFKLKNLGINKNYNFLPNNFVK